MKSFNSIYHCLLLSSISITIVGGVGGDVVVVIVSGGGVARVLVTEMTEWHE